MHGMAVGSGLDGQVDIVGPVRRGPLAGSGIGGMGSEMAEMGEPRLVLLDDPVEELTSQK